jgi:sarcosine oxidase
MTRVAVIGAGIVGLATATALAERRVEVTLYERGEPGGGQSAGRTRIFRFNHADPRLIELALDAHRIWREWEEVYATRLVGDEGVLVVGPQAEARLSALQAAGVDAAWADRAAQLRRLPIAEGFDAPAIVEPGGAIRAATAITTLSGPLGERLVRADVLAVQPAGDAVEVLTPQGSTRYDGAVVCAGHETARLARQLGVELPVELTMHLRATFRRRTDTPAALACLQDSSGEHGETVYAAAAGELYAVGLAGHAGQLEGEPLPALDDLRRRAAAYVTRGLPGLHPEPVDDVTCWVTELPWGPDGVAAWAAGRVTFVAGHNLFKLAPVLGRLLADAARDGAAPELLLPANELGGGAPTR